MPRHRAIERLLVTLACALALVVFTGCNVLFVPRKPVPSPTGTPNPAIHRFPDLEARIPDQIDARTLEKFSLTSNPELQGAKTLEVLQRLGKTTADVQLAKGSATGLDLTIVAMRIAGTNAAQAAATFEAVDESDAASTSTYVPAVVAGKRVLIRTTGKTTAYMYPVEDILFILTGPRPLAEAGLTAIN